MSRILLCLLLLSGSRMIPQSLDSMRVILASSAPDTVKIKKLNEKGWRLLMEGDHKGCFYYCTEARKLAQKVGFAKGLSRAYNNIGNAFYYQANYPEALLNFFEALKIYERIGDRNGAASAYNNIGNLYDSMEKYDDAIANHLKALELRKNTTDKFHLAQSHHNIALVYLNKRDFSKAMENFLSSLAIAKELQDTLFEATCYSSIAVLHSDQQDFQEALRYNLLALKLREQVGELYEIAKSYVNIGEEYYSIDRLKEAEEYAKKGLSLAKELESIELEQVASLTLSNVYAKRGDHKRALALYKQHVRARDSLFNNENTEKVVQAKMNFEFERERDRTRAEQEKRDLLAKEESRIKDLRLTQSRYMLYGLVLLFVLSGLVFWLVVKQNRLRAEQRSVMAEQKLLRAQMNPHFIFNSLIAIESFIYKNEPREAGRYLSGFARLMRGILENSREEYVSLDKEVSTLRHYLDLQKLRFEDRFTYTIDIDDAIDPEGLAIPPMLAQPFIENSIEHGIKNSERMGLIQICFSRKDHDLLFEVSDNGIGIGRSGALRENKEKHRSLATVITNERLALLNKGKKSKVTISIEEIHGGAGDVAGTRVSFLIPFREV